MRPMTTAGILIALMGCASGPREQQRSAVEKSCFDGIEWPADLTRPKSLFAPQPGAAGRPGTTQACLELRIDEAGNTAAVAVVASDFAPFTEAAAEIARTWRFEPAKRGADPVAVSYRVVVTSRR